MYGRPGVREDLRHHSSRRRCCRTRWRRRHRPQLRPCVLPPHRPRHGSCDHRGDARPCTDRGALPEALHRRDHRIGRASRPSTPPNSDATPEQVAAVAAAVPRTILALDARRLGSLDFAVNAADIIMLDGPDPGSGTSFDWTKVGALTSDHRILWPAGYDRRTSPTPFAWSVPGASTSPPVSKSRRAEGSRRRRPIHHRSTGRW
ncbi:MAG: hypothetical protein R2710_08235 [Acidimicrobiales bacterium]